MGCWESDMPEEVAQAYAVWSTVATRNVSETARVLGMRRPTVQEWSQKYRWRERLANEDAADRDRTIAHAWARMTGLVLGAVSTVEAAIAARHDAAGKPPPGSPTPTALKAAFGTLATFGITPQRATTLTLQPAPALPAVTDAELEALLAAGDTATLIALAAGKPPPPLPAASGIAAHDAPYPRPPSQDFSTGQPDGRVGRGPTSSEKEGAIPEASVVDAAFRAAGERVDGMPA